ncbi:hypothetical protein ABT120_32910 [Nonomuraea angiospora]|uniref:hypothetical protein n=1 Tax=Nonomuraea angiospora TaxID=46172 RepID=UPI003324CCB5
MPGGAHPGDDLQAEDVGQVQVEQHQVGVELGFGMRRFGLPVLPLIVGVILGPRAELQGRRSLQLSGGDLSGLLGGPVSYTIYAVILVLLAWPLIKRLRRG